MFAHEMWNVFIRVLEGFQRTNNNLEGWHNKMRPGMRATQFNVYEFIGMLRTEARDKDGLVDQMRGGARPPVCAARVRERNERIVRIVERFDDPHMTRLQYLRAIARNF